MPASARTASNEVVNWPAVADEEPEAVARSLRSISRLRACCVVQAPVGWLVVRRMCRYRLPTSRACPGLWALTHDPTSLQGSRPPKIKPRPHDHPATTTSFGSHRRCFPTLYALGAVPMLRHL